MNHCMQSDEIHQQSKAVRIMNKANFESPWVQTLCFILGFALIWFRSYIKVPDTIGFQNENLAIDAVYTWVNGGDSAWLAKKELAEKKYPMLSISKKANTGRYVDYGEMRYSLRSIEKFTPWVRKIFIVTANQTIPYVNSSNPKIVYVDHSTIFPPTALPSFNSNAIEFSLSNIPGLSNQFLYLNDDTFFSRPLNKADFFGLNGEPKLYTKFRSWRNSESNYIDRRKDPNRNDSDRLQFNAAGFFTASIFRRLASIEPHDTNVHSIFPSSLQLMAKSIEVFGDYVNQTIHHQFRLSDDLQYQRSMIFTCLAHPKLCRRIRVGLFNRYSWVVNKQAVIGDVFKGMKKYSSDFMTLCINTGAESTDSYREKAQKFLMNWLSETSEFEIK
ncbi:sugar phosphotransferase [Histomonas meleagridis]|uniref:sugar phosphotransferase n=1 Tax=Histomonas meleagridis TaxID=135588 RepID=UPI003559EBB7|nr:sugar phosphotransferase [Histomonas meleagridis]KAH0796322.1 sugar phosphotransferase [Histomonas meleagridis]